MPPGRRCNLRRDASTSRSWLPKKLFPRASKPPVAPVGLPWMRLSRLSTGLSRPDTNRSLSFHLRSRRLYLVPTSRATGDLFVATGKAPVGLCGLSTLFAGPRRGTTGTTGGLRDREALGDAVLSQAAGRASQGNGRRGHDGRRQREPAGRSVPREPR